jgi:outer membrane murein-binding lipoprotein Lpp
MAAERGHSGAQQCLGWLYENGHGVPKDYAQAVVWYRKAVNQGHSGAAENLQACRDKMTLETRMEQCRRAVEAGDREAARYHDWVDEHYSEFLVNWLPSQFTEEWLARYNEAIPEEQAQRPDWWAESMPELVSRIADATTERDPDESASDQGEKDAANKRLEAKLDKIAAKYGPKMTGHFHVQRPASEDPVLMAANEVFQKAARRKVN